ncbi:MAG: methionyl aminopeptidase [Desulfosalsimonas sp.]
MKNNTKTGRNDPCPCGSGKKYKKCCMGRQTDTPVDIKKWYKQKYDIRLKEPRDIEGIRAAGRIVLESLDMVEESLRAGMTTDEINTIVHEHAEKYGAVPAPLNYRGFPKSVCTSVNDVICHGIPGEYVLEDGDIINVDVTHIYKGYYADASKTFYVGTPGPEARKIVEVAAGSLKAATEVLAPDNTVGDIGWAIQRYAESRGCSVVREFVGHGVGFDFHEPPQVPHYGKKGQGIVLVPGMVFTVEPMINLGKPQLFIRDDGWTAVTSDRKLSAQFEQTFVITETGYENLTPYPL